MILAATRIQKAAAAATSLPLKVNLPISLGVFLVFLGSQTLILLGLYDAPIGGSDAQLFFLWIGVLAHALFGLFAVMLVFGALGARLSRLSRAFLWVTLLAASTCFVWDAIAYSMVGLHLQNAARLLWENVFTDRQIMQTRMKPLVMILAGYVLLFVGGAPLVSSLDRRLKFFAWESAVRPMLALVAVSLLLALGLQFTFRKAVAKKLYAASVERLLSFGKIAKSEDAIAGALFDVRSAWFRAPPRPDSYSLASLSTTTSTPSRLPDIILVVSDSVRRDVITPEITPHLSAFGRACLPIEKTMANANGTHPSLTAIIHGLHPLYHGVYFGQEDYPGALPLRVLKKLGYEINVLASPDLEYFKFAKAAFSRNHALADYYLDQKSLPKLDKRAVGQADELIFDEAIKRLARTNTRPRFFFLMLDSTHFEYSWAKNFEPPFKPYIDRVPALPMGMSKEQIEALRNRYKNSVAYVDSLMGKLLSTLRQQGTLEKSIVIFTGDHGEEFLEQGHLFHGGSLNRHQIEVPILMHFPRGGARDLPQRVRLASHVDLFPTIFDYLGVSGGFMEGLSGQSLLGTNAPEYCISIISAWVKQPGWFPVCMTIDIGERKLVMDFVRPQRIGRSLFADHVIGLRVVDSHDNEIPAAPRRRGEPGHVPPEFERALKKVLSTTP